MQKKKWKLQPVLDVRDKAKQQAARTVAARRAQLEEAQAELARRERALAACREQQAAAQSRMMEEIKQGLTAGAAVSHRTHLADLRQLEEELMSEVEKQTATVARAEQELEKALNALIEASKELKVIEKHRENWHATERREEAHRTQKLQDEIGTIIHGKKEK